MTSGRVLLTLTASEQEAAKRRAAVWLGVHDAGCSDRFEPRSDKERLRVDRAGADLALARFLGGKIPKTIVVRHTAIPTGCLIIGRSDRDRADRAYVLVIGTLYDSYRVLGWRWGRERTRGKWRSDVRCPGFFIEQDDLRAPEGLRDV